MQICRSCFVHSRGGHDEEQIHRGPKRDVCSRACFDSGYILHLSIHLLSEGLDKHWHATAFVNCYHTIHTMPSEHFESAASPQRVPSNPLLHGQDGTPPQAGSSQFERYHEASRRTEGSPSRNSFSSSLNQKTPARSFYHHRSTKDSSRKWSGHIPSKAHAYDV